MLEKLNELQRLAWLMRYSVNETTADECFDTITELIAEIKRYYADNK